MNIKPIRSKKDYQNALARIEKLMHAKKGSREGDELDVLATLVDVYEQKYFPVDDPDPISAILHRMDSLDMTRGDLEGILGSKSRVSEILTKRRKLSMEMIRNIHRTMHIPAATLIQDYTVRT